MAVHREATFTIGISAAIPASDDSIAVAAMTSVAGPARSTGKARGAAGTGLSCLHNRFSTRVAAVKQAMPAEKIPNNPAISTIFASRVLERPSRKAVAAGSGADTRVCQGTT